MKPQRGTDEYRAYDAIHHWVRDNYGKASSCEHCRVEGKAVYHWSNKSGGYLKDRDDWQQLCPKCHYWHDVKKLVR